MIKFERRGSNSIRIDCPNDDIFRSLRESFAVDNPAARFSTSAFTQQRFYAISPLGTFKPGLMKDVYEAAKTLVGKDGVILDSSIRDIVAPSLRYEKRPPAASDIVARSAEITISPQQAEAISKALFAGRSVVVSPTGSGKGMMIFGIADQLISLVPNFKYILLTVPNVQLVHQLHEEGVKYGFAPENIIKYWTKNRLIDFDDNVKIVITNRGFIQQPANFRIFSRESQPSVVMVDEVHTVKKAAKFSNLISALNTPYRFGFTGTVSPARYDELQMKGLIGPIVYEETITNLQEIGRLSNIVIYEMMFKYSASDLSNLGYHSKMKELKARHKLGKLSKKDIIPQLHTEEFKLMYLDLWCKTQIRKLVDAFGTENTLILYDNTEIGDAIFDMLRSVPNKSVYQISGATPGEERLRIQKQFEASDNQLLVAQTQTFSTGINIRNIRNIVFAFSSKSFVKIIQSIGRGLRPLVGKLYLRLVDISSNLQYSSRHAKARRKLYTDNYGKADYDLRKILLPYGMNVKIEFKE